MTFLPQDYQKPSSGNGDYLKLVKGENRIRIVTAPIMGYIDWDKSGDTPRPVRTKEKQPALDAERKPKHFWALGVLHEGTTKVREITQVAIQDFIHQHALDADWGDPREYDLVITRSGDGMETKYSCIAKPRKELTAEDKANIKPIKLEVLFDGGNPFDINKDIETPF